MSCRPGSWSSIWSIHRLCVRDMPTPNWGRADSSAGAGLVFDICYRRARDLAVQGFTIGHAASQEFGPRGYHHGRVDLFRQQPPELRVVPAQIVTRTIAMGADAGAQPFHFLDELVSGEPIEIGIHDPLHFIAMGTHPSSAYRRTP